MKSKSWPFWLVFVSLFVIFLSPELLSDGMFMDGLIYAAVAKNLAHGVGTFWAPHFSETCMTPFHEHPPLALGLEALFFRLLGDGRWTERVFCLVVALGLILLIRGLWRRTVPPDLWTLAWLPVFFWFTVQLVYWSLGNNMLENVVGLFCTLSVWLYMRAPHDRLRPAWMFGSGLAVLLGVLSKGPVALFPLAVPLLARLILRRRSWHGTLVDQLWLMAGLVLPGVLLLGLSAGARYNLTSYWQVQVVNSFQNVRTVASRGTILYRLFKEILPMLLLVAAVAGLALHYRFRSLLATQTKPALFFVAIGLSASVPLTVSLKQNGFYLVPSFLFFALGGALLVGPAVAHWLKTWRHDAIWHRVWRYAGITLAAVAVGVAALQVDRIGRDREALTAVYDTLAVTGPRGRINICSSLDQSWSLHGYFARYAFVSLERDPRHVHEYLLSDGTCGPAADSSTAQIPISSSQFVLYRLAPGATIADPAVTPHNR